MRLGEYIFASLALIGALIGTNQSYVAWQQARRADAFQDKLNARIWERKAECRARAAREAEIWRAVAADAMRAEHEQNLSKQVFEGQDER